MLFTPHLYSYKGTSGANLEYTPGNDREIYETYADIMYLAAINAWVLDGHGDLESFTPTRGDFHAWMQTNPREYGKVMAFAVEALSGKKLSDFIKENGAKKTETAEHEPSSDGKKKVWAWIGKILKRSS